MQSPDLNPERLALLARLERAPGVPGHEIIAQRLRANGVTHVYGISGTPIDETLAACGRRGLRVIATRHQQTAVQAAAAQNFLAGGLKAVVIVSAGPGVSNCTTGIALARDNHWPLLVIGGRRPRAMRDMGAFQEFDGAGLFASITRFSVVAEDARGLGGLIDQGCLLAMQDSPGPCYLDVAEEALNGLATPRDAATSQDAPLAEAAVDWKEALAAMRHARRPVLMVGDDMRWGAPWALLKALVERYRIPFVTSPMARGFLPDSHPLCGTRVRHWLLGEADLVLMAGASLNWIFRHGAEIRTDADLVRLAFRHDPAFGERTRRVEYLGNPAGLLRQLADTLYARPGYLQVDESWLARLALRRQTYQHGVIAACEDSAMPLTPARWLREVASAVPDNAVTILDGNVTMAWAQHLLAAELPLSRLTAGVNGCMGVGLPFALAAKLVRPDDPALAIVGDFAIGLCITDLETAVRHRLAVVIIVANNGGSGGSLRQRTYWPSDYPESICQFTPGVRYDRIMQALGGVGLYIDHHGQIAPALDRAFTSRQPVLIQIDTRDDVPLPDL